MNEVHPCNPISGKTSKWFRLRQPVAAELPVVINQETRRYPSIAPNANFLPFFPEVSHFRTGNTGKESTVVDASLRYNGSGCPKKRKNILRSGAIISNIHPCRIH